METVFEGLEEFVKFVGDLVDVDSIGGVFQGF